MMHSADMFMEAKSKEIDGILRILAGRTHTLTGTIEDIKGNITERDDGGLLEYFALEFPRIAQSTDSDLPQLKEISDQAQLKCNIQTESLSKFIDQIQNMQLEITNMDGEIHDVSDLRELYAEERGKSSSVMDHVYSKKQNPLNASAVAAN